MDEIVYRSGAVFSIMALTHFAIDFMAQSEKEAYAKSTNWRVRANHAMWYTIGMTVGFSMLGVREWWKAPVIMAILFISHFLEDTYAPVKWWFKNMRKPMSNAELTEMIDKKGLLPSDVIKYHATQMILAITVDQIIHLYAVFVCCYIAVL